MIPTAPSVEKLLAAADQVFNTTLALSADNPHNRANMFGWLWAWAAEACLVAYERTGDERCLDWVPRTYETILEWRDCELGLYDEYRNRVTQSWGSGRYLPGIWMTHVTMGGRITYPSLRFADIVLERGISRHVDAAKRYIEIASAVAHEYDEDFVHFESVDEWYYHMPLKNEVDTINHVHSLVDVHIALWKLNGDTECRDKAIQCFKVFRAAIKEVDGCYSWPLRPLWTNHRNNRRAEPLWKASVTTHAVLNAWRAGIYFNDADISAFARTISDVLMPGQFEIRDRVGVKHGITQWDEMDPRYRSRLVSLVGFFPWGDIDPAINSKIKTRVAENNTIFGGNALSRAPGIVGYPYFLASS